MNIAGTAEVVLNVKDKSKKGLKKTEANVSKTVDKLNSKFTNMGKNLAAAFGGVVVLNAIKNLSSAALSLGSDLLHTSNALGITVEELSALSDIARDVGTDFSAVEKAMMATTQQLENARSGSKKLADIFDALDIDINTASVTDVNDRMLELFNNTKNSAEQQKLLGQAQVIWGKKGADAFAKLATGANSTEDAINKVGEAGRLMSEETSKRLEKISTQFDAMKQTITVGFAKGFAQGFEGFNTKKLNKSLQDVGDKLGDLVADITEVGIKITEFVDTPLGNIIAKLAIFGGVIKGIAWVLTGAFATAIVATGTIITNFGVAAYASFKLAGLEGVHATAIFKKLAYSARVAFKSALKFGKKSIVVGGMLGELKKSLLATRWAYMGWAAAIAGATYAVIDSHTKVLESQIATTDKMLDSLTKLTDKYIEVKQIAIDTIGEALKAREQAAKVDALISKTESKNVSELIDAVNTRRDAMIETFKVIRMKYAGTQYAITMIEKLNKAWDASTIELKSYEDALDRANTGVKKLKFPEEFLPDLDELEKIKLAIQEIYLGPVNVKPPAAEEEEEEEIKLDIFEQYAEGIALTEKRFKDFLIATAGVSDKFREKIRKAMDVKMPGFEKFKEGLKSVIAPINAIGNTLNKAFSGFADLFGNRVNVIKEELQVLRDSAAADAERMKELNLLESKDYLARKKRNEKEIESKKKAAAEEWRHQQDMRMGQAMMTAILGASNAYASAMALGPIGLILGPINAAIAMASGMVQYNMIKGEKTPQFRLGGMIPGNPNEDKTPILAQGGEFMMNRSATEANLGMLEFMNRGGKAGNAGGEVHIHIDGNVIQSDNWVEETLIPSINNAFDRGVNLAFA